VEAQAEQRGWYQKVRLGHGIVTPGKFDPMQRLEQIGLPEDLSGRSVLDVGCNSGALCLECKRRRAGRVVGIDVDAFRLEQGRTMAEIMGLDVEFRERDLFGAPGLGAFDIVFCVAVLTEVTDLVGGLEALKQLTRGTLYLEIATLETYPGGWRGLLSRGGRALASLIRGAAGSPLVGTAKLRRSRSKGAWRWSLVPDRRFLDAVIGEDFDIADLGPSVRYNLFKLERRGPVGDE
jgi:2-polyprenyl-3-methyl-5-hydroxy-6-metoxy-1,4-benzoquinol methylase